MGHNPLNTFTSSVLEIDVEPKVDLHNKELFLLDIAYKRITIQTNELSELILYTRDKMRNRFKISITNFNPYFYVNASKEEINTVFSESAYSDWLIDIEEVHKIEYNGGKPIVVNKIIGKRPWQVPKIRDLFLKSGFQYFEADIPYVQRFLLDTQLYGMRGIKFSKIGVRFSLVSTEMELEPIIMGFDIEIDLSIDTKESISYVLEEANKRITAISLWWGRNEIEKNSQIFFLESDNDSTEKLMIQSCFEFIWEKIDPDVIVTYNGDNFDLPYLEKRMRKLGLNNNILTPYSTDKARKPAFGRGWILPGLLAYDLFKRTKWLYTEDGKKSLGSVSKQLLGKEKGTLVSGHGKIWHQALFDLSMRNSFEAYALKDAELTYQLFFAMKMQEWLQVIRVSGLTPAEAMYFTERQTGEFSVFRHMVANGIIIPPIPTNEEKKIRKKERKNVQGGLVFNPIRSLSKSVLICDFTSMYPSIITSHNIGLESYKGKSIDPRHSFRESPRTSMALFQDDMLHRRIAVKERMGELNDDNEIKQLVQYNTALKLVANSTFGSYNFIGSRFYNYTIGSAITKIGRNYLNQISMKVEELGSEYRTIYGDTDSVFIETPLHKEVDILWKLDESEIKPIHLEKILAVVNHLKDILPAKMRLELQDVAYRILFHRGAKKRYTFISAITKKISILGLEAIRNDWAPLSKDIQKFVINIILTTGDLKEAKKRVITYIRNEIKDKENLKTRVVVLGPLKRDPARYKSITPAISAFNHYSKLNKIDPKVAWKEFDQFPYIIIRGKGPLINRSRHPDFVNPEDIDIDYYISRSLAAINRFNLDISLKDVYADRYTSIYDFFDD